MSAIVAFPGMAWRFAALAVALCSASACSGDDAAAKPDAAMGAPDPDAAPDAWLGPDFSKLVPACFGGAATPQLDFTGPMTNWTWNDPHVLKVGSEYWMYASATNYFQFPVRSYRLTSTDATTWSTNGTPILHDAPTTPQRAWDAGGIETPAVVFFKGAYHMFYTAYPYPVGDAMHEVTSYRIGHATSTDGITFTRVGTTPVFETSGTDADPSNDWYSLVVGEPGPVVVNDTLYVYFTAFGPHATLGTLQVIGVVSSTDGTTWSTPQLAVEPDQTVYPRAQDWVGYSTPNAILLDGTVHLFFDVARQPQNGDWKQIRIHHAKSPDGLTGWQQDSAPIRSAGDYAWAVDEIRSPHAFLDDKTLRLWIAGHELDGVQPDHFGIGMLTCDLAVH